MIPHLNLSTIQIYLKEISTLFNKFLIVFEYFF